MTIGNKRFVVDLGWGALLANLGIAPRDLLRHARLPGDLFSRADPTLGTDEYFRLWNSLESLLDDPALPIRLVQAVQVEAFSPPLFAAFCSPNLNVALTRLSQYKPLIGPMRLDVSIGDKGTEAVLRGLPAELPPPPSLLAMELVFLVNLARLGTRERIVPTGVQSAVPVHSPKLYADFLGIAVQTGPETRVVFSAEDAARPFLSANAAMFSVFEPELRRRLDDLNSEDGFRERVRACLMEALAAGQYSMADIADRLAVSTRTLQRRLQNEGSNFQNELNGLRGDLARHYLAKTQYSSAEISFLLGYDDPNSFIRAFHGWTGNTPERMRSELRVN